MTDGPVNPNHSHSLPGVSGPSHLPVSLLRHRALDAPPRAGLIAAVDRFEVLTRQDVVVGDIDAAMLKDKPWVGPAIVVAQLPADLKERQRLLEETLFDGKPDIQKRPEFWTAFANATDEVFSRARPIAELRGQDPESTARIEALINTSSQSDNLVYLPIMGKQDIFSLILDPVSHQPVGLIDLDPWEVVSANPGSVESASAG